MSFLSPAFLWGLVALAVPVIVHFFYLRRAKKYEFSQAALVERLRQASRPYLRLRHWILLLLRLGAVTAIVLLFARPKVGVSASLASEGASVLVVWDVSPSMMPVFAQSQALLREVLQKAPPSYEYRLLTTDSYLPKGGFVSAKLLMERLQEVQPASMGYPIATLLERGAVLFANAQYPVHKVYILSDFQSSSIGDIARIPAQAFSEIVLIPVSSPLAGNAYIDSLLAFREGSEWRVRFHLHGTPGRLYTIRTKGLARSFLPGIQEVRFPAEATALEIQIEGDELPFDNVITAGLRDVHSAQIGWGMPTEPSVEKLHQLLGIQPKPPRNSEDWDDLSIFVGLLSSLPDNLPTWVAEGGTLITFPPAELSPAVWQRTFLSAELSLLGSRDIPQPIAFRPVEGPFWESVFIRAESPPALLAEPLRLRKLYEFRVPTGQPLLLSEEGMPLLWELPWGKGRVYLFTFPWEGSGLSRHSLLVPLFARLYQWGERADFLWAIEAGRRRSFTLKCTERPRLRHIATGTEYLPSAERKGAFWQFSFGDQPLPLGLYEVRGESQTYALLGLNVSVEESSAPILSSEVWEKAGLPVRLVEWSGDSLQTRKLGWAWRDWHLWLLLTILLLVGETFWARRLLRPSASTLP
ncbi:MAG: BatA domain-containing protein [Bacteroidia bacterium]|nr:BatA domain-containing protein [Bacteroidia bacterium]MCX7652740.1 BatA domain-containing protein [Bacteroidia bacterium]MDW8417278.1 BatA domain-containing protein [Bacteroidia bacterium]